MSLANSIAYNSVVQIVGKVISIILGVVVIRLTTEYLDPSAYGQYIIVLTFLQFFGIIVDFGLYIVLIKKISEPNVDHRSLISNVFTLRLVSAIVFLGLAPIVVLLFPYAPEVRVGVAVASFSVLFITLNQLLIGLFQRHLAMARATIAELVGRIALIGATLAAIALHVPLSGILWAVVIGSLAQFIALVVASRRYVRLRLAFDFPVWARFLAESWPVALSIVFNLIYFKVDTIILSLYYPESAVGLYGAPYKVLEVLITVPAMFAGLVTPVITQAWATGDRNRFREVLSRSFETMGMVALPIVAGIFVLAPQVMGIVAPPAYAASAPILRILIFATGSIFIGNLFGNTVVAIGRQKPMVFIYAAVAVISLIGYFTLIPRFSYFGAASVTVFSEFAVTFGSAFIVWRATRTLPTLRIFWRAAASAGIMALVLFIGRSLPLIPLIIIGAGIYLVLLFVTRALTRQTIAELRAKPITPATPIQ